MFEKIKQSRFSLHGHVAVGAVLFGLTLYPMLSSAQTMRERTMIKPADVSVETIEADLQQTLQTGDDDFLKPDDDIQKL